MAAENESAVQTAPNIDITENAKEIISSVQGLDLHTVIYDWLIPYGSKIILAIVIYWVGKRLARLFSTILGKAVARSSGDEMLQSFVRSISYFALLLMVVIAALSQIGINTTSLVALIGAAGLAIGLSLQNSLQNFAAGVMILIFKPFRKGDYIEAGGVAGSVEQIGLLVLELRTADNKTVLVPNGKVFGDSITNYSINETRRIDFIFDIAYEADIRKAKEVIALCLEEEPRVLRHPEPLIAVGALESSSVQLFVRPWVKTADFFAVQFALTERVKLEFDRAGIEIPYNQLDIRFPEKELAKLENTLNDSH
ncbi:mechanosensitive ion channel family protein [Spirabiliibacterium falconis]|uniref:mechanosensitive ion channel family protein n=1 Tax=Spirabiliibacterium falconis TaxID=572023 RepID=UPI001AAD22D2|nr:mechanosensitive ion channel domain-containing protein [Spirabiliibacterium falconis]MBE2894222.1 mechanosensitive ion channel [Spirabiliibacterium falconis]